MKQKRLAELVEKPSSAALLRPQPEMRRGEPATPPSTLDPPEANDSKRILIAEDDDDTRDLIGLLLKQAGFEVAFAHNGAQALEVWQKQPCDLIILDIMMPVLDGLETCRRIRETSDVPIIFLTVKGEEQHVEEGFAAGAYDYVVKPFKPRELVARIRAILQHAASSTPRPAEHPRLVYEDLELDVKARRVRRQGRIIRVTPSEFRLLQYFIQHAGEVVTKQDLLRHVWGHSDVSGDLNLVDSAIKRLRKKIETHSKEPRYLHTVWGIGYRFGRKD